MKKLTVATLILLCPLQVHADPVTIFAAIAANAWAVAALKVLAVVAIGAYKASSARKKARRARAAAVSEHNANLEERFLTYLSATPPHRFVMGRCIAGGDVLASFYSDHTYVNEDGKTVTKKDAYRHLVIHLASHTCASVHDVLFEGVNFGPLDANGWTRAWEESRTIVLTGRARLPYSAVSLDSATDGTSSRLAEMTLSDDKRIVTGPANVKIRLTYTALRDDFIKGSNSGTGPERFKATRNLVITGGTLTATEDVLRVVSAFTPGQGDNGPTDVTVTVSPDKRTLTASTTAETQVVVEVGFSRPLARVQWHLGLEVQAANAYLMSVVPNQWTAQHTLNGLCYAVVTLDLEHQPFQSGPQGLSFDVSGMLVLDPRTGLTAHTQNNALLTNAFLRSPWGLDVPADAVNQDYLIASANVCDQPTTFIKVDPDFPSITETITAPRYTCNGAFTSDDSKEGVLDMLEGSMAGWIHDSGEWLIVAGDWTPPVRDLTDDDLAGPIEIMQADNGLEDTFNGARGRYLPAQKTSQSEFTPYSNAVMVTADGGELWEDLQLPLTDSAHRCTNLARIKVEQSRLGLTVKYPGKQRLWRLQVGDRVRVTSSQLNCTLKHFRVTDWEHALSAPVSLVLQEDEADSWDTVDSLVADPTRDLAVPNVWQVSPVSGVQVTSGTSELILGTDGSISVRAKVSWDPVSDPTVVMGGRVEVRYQRVTPGNTEEPWVRAQPSSGDQSHVYIPGLRDGDRLTIKIAAYNSLGVSSADEVVAHTVVGKTEPPSDVTGLTSSVSQGVIPWAWKTPPDLDYASTEVRSDNSDWGSDVVPPLWRGKASEWSEPVVSAATVTRYFRHVDTGGRVSANTVTRAQVVGSGDLGGNAGQDALRLIPSVMTVSATSAGVVSDWSQARTSAQVIDADGNNVTDEWGYTLTAAAGVVADIGGALGNDVSISGFDAAAVASDYRHAVLQVHGYPSIVDTSQFANVPVRVGGLVSFAAVHTPPVGLGYINIAAGTWSGVFAYAGMSGHATTGVLLGADSSLSDVGRPLVDMTGGPWEMSAFVRCSAYAATGELALMGHSSRAIVLTTVSGVGIRYSARWTHQARGGYATASTDTSIGESSTPVAYGTWAHVKLAYCSDGRLRLWVAGALVASQNVGVGRQDGLHPDSPPSSRFAIAWDRASSLGQAGPEIQMCEIRCLIGIDNTSAGYTPPVVQFADGAFPAVGRIGVTASQPGKTALTAAADLVVIAGPPPSVLAFAVPASLSLPASWFGGVTGSSLPSALKVLVGGVDDTANWSMAVTADQVSGVVPSISGKTITAISMNTARSSGEFRVWLTKPGHMPQYVVIPVSKTLAAQPTQTASITPSITLAGDIQGQVASYAGATGAARRQESGVDQSSTYGWTVTASAGITVSNTGGGNFAVTSISDSVDSGTITVVSSKSGWTTMTSMCAVFKTRLLLPSGAVVASLPAISIFDDASAATVGLRLTSDGRVQVYRQNATGAWVTVANYYNPTTSAIGAGYRVRLLGTPAGSASGTWNAWQALSSDVTWQAGSEVGGGVGSHGWTLHQIQIATTTSTDILATYLVTATAIIESA